ncbi:MAG: 50S ribosomal protein L29 [Cyanobacteriota bacterium]|nr:50S ribosomal protein L29 [Cyanobacteriota bacterium]
MPMSKIADARALSDEDLSEEIMKVKRELFELRLQKATRQLTQPHLIRMSKHRLAQLLTVEGERQRGITLTQSPQED